MQGDAKLSAFIKNKLLGDNRVTIYHAPKYREHQYICKNVPKSSRAEHLCG